MKLNDVSITSFALYLLCGLALTYDTYTCPANKNDKEFTLLHYLTTIFFWPVSFIGGVIWWLKIKKDMKKH